MILCILEGDVKEFRKALLNGVRHERKGYDMRGIFFGPWTYLMKHLLTMKHGSCLCKKILISG